MVLALPLFKYLDVDTKLTRNTLTVIFEETPDDFLRIMMPGTLEFDTFYGFLRMLSTIPDELITFRVYLTEMLDFFFERLKKRNEEYYAVGVYDFFSNREIQRDISASLPPSPVYLFQQSRSVRIEYGNSTASHDADLITGKLFAGVSDCRAAAHDAGLHIDITFAIDDSTDTSAALVLYPTEAGYAYMGLAVDDGYIA